MATRTKAAGKAGPKPGGARHDPEGRETNASLPETRSHPRGMAQAPGAVGADPAYLALIRRLPLRPIRTEAELDAAAGLIDELTDREDLSEAEADYLDVLGDLVEKYEDAHVASPPVSDAEMLRSLMAERGLRQADVVRGTGLSKTVLSLVLNGKRELTREHIAALSRYLGVNPAAFLGGA